jgi:hypothetical protein
VTGAPSELIPFRWPAEWRDPAAFAFLKGTPVNCLAGVEPPPVAVGEIPFIKLDENNPPEGVTLLDGVWPRVLPAEEEDAAIAGVTGGPWVDSNAGRIRLAQAKAPGRQVWLTYVPPGPKEIVPPEEYVRPIAEAEAYGARWVLALDAQFAAGVNRKNDRALGAWRQMMSTLELYARRREWRDWPPVAALGVVSGFDGGAQLLAEEFLSLAPRRHLAYRIVLASDVGKHSFEQQKAIIYLESAPPDGEARATLLRFAENGGTVFAPRGTLQTQPAATSQEHAIHQLGRGRVITPLDIWEDPFALVRQVQLLLSVREDVVQVWNGGDMNSHSLSSPDGRRGVVHLIPYSSGLTLPITIGPRQPCRSARVTTLAGTRAVKPVAGALGVEIPVGEFSGFAAVELEA